MQLQMMTWQDVDRHLEKSKAIIIPVGSTEQHGPNGLIGTDALCPQVLANGIGEETGAVIAPTLSIGMAQHHLGFSGSITLRPSTLMAVVGDVVGSLARHGFERFYFLNGHGGNIATLNAAFSEIYAEYSLGKHGGNEAGLRCKLKSWWETKAVQDLSKELFGDDEGSHATCSEVSLTYYAFPDQVRNVEMSPRRAPNGSFTDSHDYRRTFPDGRIGSAPSLATPEAGERIYKTALKDLKADYLSFAG